MSFSSPYHQEVVETTWPDTGSAWDTSQSVDLNISRIGNIVMLSIDQHIHNGPDVTNVPIISGAVIPAEYRPTSDFCMTLRIKNLTDQVGVAVIKTTGEIQIYPDISLGSWNAVAGTIGFYCFHCCYRLN